MEALQLGRDAIRKQAWAAAFSQLSAADQDHPLAAEDVERLAMAAHLTGREVESADLLARAHQAFLGTGDTHRAVRCALWLGYRLLFGGEMARASGWLARANRLLDGHPDCVEHGYLLLPEGIRAIYQGDAMTAHDAFIRAGAIGNRFGDRDLATMALNGQGRTLIRMGDSARGVTLLDEAMVAVTAGEVSPIIAGTVYCSVIESCQETLDLRRAREWTSALTQWCANQPEMVPFRGACLLHRAEVMQLGGAWQEALDETRRACEQFSQPAPKPSLGAAFYRMAELHRLRGELPEAEAAYQQANHCGCTPQPGFALLRLAQGQLETANAAIRAAVHEAREPLAKAMILEAFVEIVLAAKDVPAARTAAAELAEIAKQHRAPFLHAVSSHAAGAVLLAEGDSAMAIRQLRQAWNIWCELEIPYQAARVRVLISQACRTQGDHDTAQLELAAARHCFEQLGALTDLARLDEPRAPLPESPLSTREIEVLRLVASGATNRDIASQLGISEKTIARHISNIFVKLDLTSRAAATAYAYQQGLVQTRST